MTFSFSSILQPLNPLLKFNTPPDITLSVEVKGGGGQTFFRAFINSELGPPEVAPCMARTFGGVSGHRRQTGSEPRPAQIWSQK